ncbi:restriction endonuclease subunit S [Hoeflea sp. TYP-13]|uniref:restriction endonuclease subunit S n=1 Tax=Hoeflea sp. TYP-13 TaxID=3230023 RepID=UPI0034C67D30
MSDPATLLVDHLDIWTGAVERKNGAGRGNGGKLSLCGIEKLRSLIFDLAVRGKLVPQDMKDEPSSSVLSKIEAAAKKLSAEKKIRGSIVCRPLSRKYHWYHVPQNWEWIALGSCTNYGFSEKTNGNGLPPDTWVLELEDIEKRTSRLIQKLRFEERTFRSSKSCFQSGDVVYGKLRPYLDKVIVADEDGVCTTEMIPIRGHYGIDPHYLRIYLKSPHFVEFASSSVHGMNLPRLGTNRAREAPFPIPPLAEQKRIVAKVDELLALVDALEAGTHEAMAAHDTLVLELLATLVNSEDADELAENWSRIEAHFDTLFTTDASIESMKQTILELAVRGKLIKHEPDPHEKALDLLGQIATRRDELIRMGIIRRDRVKPYPTASPPFTIPQHWHWARIGEIALFTQYGTSQKAFEGTEGIPVLAMGNIQSGAVDTLSEKRIPDNSPELPDLFLQPGDLLYNRTNSYELVGKTGLFQGAADSFTFASYLIRIKLHPESTLPEFVNMVMNSSFFRSTQVEPKITKQTGQANVNGTSMRSMLVPLPPHNEQQQIVERYKEFLHVLEGLRNRIIYSNQLSIRLADELTAGQN